MADVQATVTADAPMDFNVQTAFFRSRWPTCSGLSQAGGKRYAHFTAPVPDDFATTLLALQVPLLVSVADSKMQIVANNTDSTTITCADPRILSDTQITYRVFFEGLPPDEPVTAPVTAGRIDLVFKAAVPGTYQIQLQRFNGVEQASVTITATEA